MAQPATRLSSDVFINVPFDRRYERVFLALIVGTVGLGLNPRSVLEIPASTDRLTRLLSLLRQCPFSLHDLSRVELTRARAFRVPRFNMPFELGLAVAVALQGHAHDWRMLEAVPHRLNHSLSDVDGYDPSIHDGTVRGTFEALLDVFDNLPNPPLDDVDELLWVYRRLQKFRRILPAVIYRPNAFRRLVFVARGLVSQRQAFLQAPPPGRHRRSRPDSARKRRRA